jgi:hypothetical protein
VLGANSSPPSPGRCEGCAGSAVHRDPEVGGRPGRVVRGSAPGGGGRRAGRGRPERALPHGSTRACSASWRDCRAPAELSAPRAGLFWIDRRGGAPRAMGGLHGWQDAHAVHPAGRMTGAIF